MTPRPTKIADPTAPRHLGLLITVSSLGYFVDVFDILLFGVVRTKSLLELGVAKADALKVGLDLFNWQMGGVLLGGFVWGMIGDRRGRLSVLFGSIILYSLANIANAYATTVAAYQVCRFCAGFGLAGELGAGVTLVSECMSTRQRGWGTMLVATVGIPGAMFAAWVGNHFDWRTAYIIGGGMGLTLLLMRLGLLESGLYTDIRHSNVARGSLRLLFRTRERIWRFVLCNLVGLSAYFVIGILILAAPEFGQALHLDPAPNAGDAISYSYAGLTVGGVLCSGLSQWLGRRKPAFILFHLISLAGVLIYLYWTPSGLPAYYAHCVLLGVGVGFWALMVTNAAEQFGTNLRATVTTAVPNLVRGAQIPISLAFEFARGPKGLNLGIIGAATLVGVTCITLAIAAVALSRETFDRTLDFIEE